MRSLEHDIEQSSAELENSERREDFLFNDVGKERAHDFVVDVVPAAEDVLAECERLLS